MPKNDTPSQNVLRWQMAWFCLALATITMVVFGQCAQFDFINFDDDEYVINNPMVVHGLTFQGIIWAFTHFHAANWHPLTWISHMLDCEMYGLEPGDHHLTNVLIHTATVVVLFLVLQRMTGAAWGSAFVAAVFAIHPLRAESVAWVSERKDVLSGLFFVLTIGAYAGYARRPWSPARYGLVVLLFAVGLLCKPMLVTVPLVFLLLDYWPLQRAKPAWNLILEKLPLLMLSVASCIITIFAQKHAISPFEKYPFDSRLAEAVISYKTYLVQMVYPVNLAAFYPIPLHVSFWEKMFSVFLLAAISVLAWAERRSRPWLLVGWLWYLIMLLPVVGIVQVGSQAHADRYTYLPQIGIYIALTWLASELAAKCRLNQTAIGGLMAGVVGILMLCAWKQASYWKNSESLWRHALAATGNNPLAYVNLGHELYRTGRLDETIALYHKAIQLEPDNAEFHNNLANALRKSGNMDEGVVEYEKAVQLDPGFVDAQFNLGKALNLQGKTAEAITRFQTVLDIDPNFLLARVNLGNALLQEGQAKQAAVQFQRVLAVSPNDADVHLNLGLSLFQMGQIAEARAQYETALQIKPTDPRIQNNLAWLLAACPVASLRDGNQAVELSREADEITGGENPVILHTMAAALAQAGDFSNAVETVMQAVQLAQAQSNQALADQLKSELELYKEGKPFPVLENRSVEMSALPTGK